MASQYASIITNLSIVLEKDISLDLLASKLSTHDLLTFIFAFTASLPKMLGEHEICQDDFDINSLMGDILWALNNLLIICDSEQLAQKITVGKNLFEEVCKFINESEAIDFDILQQTFTLHHAVALVAESQKFLQEIKEFSQQVQHLVKQLYEQNEAYDQDQLFEMIRQWLTDMNMLLKAQKREKAINE